MVKTLIIIPIDDESLGGRHSYWTIALAAIELVAENFSGTWLGLKVLLAYSDPSEGQ